MRSLCLALMLPLAACQASPPDPRGVDHDETLLTVTATGRADSRPDEARLQLGVQSQAGSAGEASRLNREKMDAVTAALQRLGVKPDDLQTRNLSLQRIDYGKERGQFRAFNVVEVTMRDMAKVGEAVTAVTEAGVRANVSVGLAYLASWLAGNGAAAINNLMEDAATAEIPVVVVACLNGFLPPLPFVSHFHEVNVRTYVHRQGGDPGADRAADPRMVGLERPDQDHGRGVRQGGFPGSRRRSV